MSYAIMRHTDTSDAVCRRSRESYSMTPGRSSGLCHWFNELHARVVDIPSRPRMVEVGHIKAVRIITHLVQAQT